MKSIIFIAALTATHLCAESVSLGNIDVDASALEEILEERTTKESADLAKEAKGETLGDFLQNEQFVDSASYGPAVGRPVVRGMDGYRVGVTNGNIILNDLSAMSQDHAVGVMARSSERIEMIKGPASLLYGNYSGGVIRVLGEEHDATLLPTGASLETVSSYGSNGSGLLLGAIMHASDYNLSLYANTFYHDATAYNDGHGDKVKDTDTTSLQSHLVLGYRFNSDHIIKLYADRMEKDYGIPNSTQERTTIEMEQERYGMVWHVADLFGAQVQTELEYSDYLHSELEAKRADGLFGQTQYGLSSQWDFQLGSWESSTNIAYKNSALQVCHEHGKCTHFFDADRTGAHVGEELTQNIETFGLPYAHGHPMPNIDESLFQAGMALKHYNDSDNEISLSLRAEFRIIDPDSRNIQEVWLVTPEINPNYYGTLQDSSLSASVGWFGYLSDAFSLQSSLGYVERLPSSTEIFWNGFHHATDSYIFGNRDINNERSINLDVDTLYTNGAWSTHLGGFYYHFFNYIYQDPLSDANGTLLIDPFHQSDVWAIQGVGARIFGAAFKERYSAILGAHELSVEAGLEAIRGMLLDGGNLPRIPTYSTTLALEHTFGNYKGNLTYRYVDQSRFEAKNETHTPSYNWLSMILSYGQKVRFMEYSLYLKGENITNAMAYNHLSFLKSTAPLGGQQFSAGLELKF